MKETWRCDCCNTVLPSYLHTRLYVYFLSRKEVRQNIFAVQQCGCRAVLVSAGTEAIFFLAAGAGLHFGVMRITLPPQRRPGRCWAALTWSQGRVGSSCSGSGQVHKELRGSTARTADPTWPRGFSTPRNVMPSTETGGSWPWGADGCLGTGRASVSGWWATLLCITSFSWVLLLFLSFLFTVITVVVIILFQLLTCSYLSPWVSLPHPTGGGRE